MADIQLQTDDLRKQALDLFQTQATQRLTTFNFYVVTASVMTTGLGASFNTDFGVPWVGVALGLVLALLSFIFWKLDQRLVFAVVFGVGPS